MSMFITSSLVEDQAWKQILLYIITLSNYMTIGQLLTMGHNADFSSAQNRDIKGLFPKGYISCQDSYQYRCKCSDFGSVETHMNGSSHPNDEKNANDG